MRHLINKLMVWPGVLPKDPTLADAFSIHHKQSWLKSCTPPNTPFHYQSMLIIYLLLVHLKRFHS